MKDISREITQRQDRDGMLRRSLERLIQLYTDKSHFVYELLQNAEDSGAHCIRFVQYPDRLEVMHDGHAFTEENLQGLCDIGQSDKVNNLNQIGEFGVGFKSVFGICDTVRLYSRPAPSTESDNCYPFSIEIEDFTRPTNIQPIEIPNNYTTLFVFPYCVGRSFSGFKSINRLTSTLSDRLKNLGVTTLLFMRSLQLIEYEIKIPGKSASGQYLLEKSQINDHCERVSAIEMEDRKTDESLSFIKFSAPISKKATNRTVDIAYLLVTDKNGRQTFSKPRNPFISVYFPTETESKLDFIVQGPFRTTPNRSSVPADDEENIKLAQQVVSLFETSLLELRDMKLLNLSLIQMLPLDESVFNLYPLFKPLYEATRRMLSTDKIIPTKEDEHYYICSKNALIARNKELTEILPDDLITKLYDDGLLRFWVPLAISERGQYSNVHSYFTRKLRIDEIRPEELRSQFNRNQAFLQQRPLDWFVQLYRLYETIPNVFRKSNTANILDARIVRTASGHIVAPYRKTSSNSYMPNAFLPSEKVNTAILSEVEYVHPYLYSKCKSFFDEVLGLTPPDEYELFVKSLSIRYATPNGVSLEEHYNDLRTIIGYMKNPQYSGDMKTVLQQSFYLRGSQNGKSSVSWVRPFSNRILFARSEKEVDLKGYYHGLLSDVYFIEQETYFSSGFGFSELRYLGVTDSLWVRLHGTEKYLDPHRKETSNYDVSGEFYWDLSIDCLNAALVFIQRNPNNKHSWIKSQTIIKTLLHSEYKLAGPVDIGRGVRRFTSFDSAEIIQQLTRPDKVNGWNGKWLYNESRILVNQSEISKHDLCIPLYGKVCLDSDVYELLGFKKGRIDQYEKVLRDYDALPEDKKQTYFAIELDRRFGITPEQLSRAYSGRQNNQNNDPEDDYEFPSVAVKNWDALIKHAVQILTYANPVTYQRIVRSIRTSRPSDDIKAYLMNMYRIGMKDKYACQLCHKPFTAVEMCQLEHDPEVELDPMNLCLCPNCATKYRAFRNSSWEMKELMASIRALTRRDILESPTKYVSLQVSGYDFWFAQTHIAEIIELIQLKQKVQEAKKEKVYDSISVNSQSADSSKEESTSSVRTSSDQTSPSETEELRSDAEAYKAYIGKRVYHTRKRAYAKVTGIQGEYIILNFESGDRAGENVKYSFAKCIDEGLIELID